MRRRAAGELFDAFNDKLREGRLAANRSQPIGAGAFGVVYESDVPGRVMKQKQGWDGKSFVTEADLQSIAADRGIAPRVHGVETFTGGVGDRIEMSDARQNFGPRIGQGKFPRGTDAIRVEQQMGELALQGVRVEDRHSGNVLYNKMTGRPLQLDFGIAQRVTGEDQVSALADATERGLAAAGLPEEGAMVSEIVYDYLAGGQVAEAMDIAKQGFSRLQKIKAPVTQNSMDQEDLAFDKMIKMMNANEAPGREQRVRAIKNLQSLQSTAREEQATDDLINNMLAKLEAKVAAQDPVLSSILAY